MALNYAKIQVQLGASLKNLRKIEALIDHVVRADNANYNRRLLLAANGYDTSVNAENKAYGKEVAFFDGSQQSTLRTIWRNYRAQLESADDFFGVLAAGLPLTDDDRKAGAIAYDYDETNGVVTIINRLGYLGALYNDMVAQSQKVVANTITPGTFTAKSGNRGQVSVSAMSFLSNALSGTMVFECVDETVDQPILEVHNELTDPTYDGDPIVEADKKLRVDRAYQDGQTGLFATIIRPGLTAPTITGDGAAIFSGVTISSPTESAMTGGVLQSRVTRQGSGDTWLIEFFNSSDRDVKVGSTTVNGTSGTQAVDVTLSGNTRFQATFSKTNANGLLPNPNDTDNDISMDILSPKEGDRWTRTVSSDDAGNFSTRLARMRRIALPIAGSNLFTDSNAAAVSMS